MSLVEQKISKYVRIGYILTKLHLNILHSGTIEIEKWLIICYLLINKGKLIHYDN